MELSIYSDLPSLDFKTNENADLKRSKNKLKFFNLCLNIDKLTKL